MDPKWKFGRPWFVLLTVSLVCTSLLVVPGLANKDKDKKDKNDAKASHQAKEYERPTDPALYVGFETCKTCHEDMPSKDFFKNYESSPHYVTTLDTKKGPEWHGCEACYGPGKAHVEGGGDKTKMFTFKNASAKEISSRCLGCHGYDEEHSNYARSAHLQNNVSCIDCPSGSQLDGNQRQCSPAESQCRLRTAKFEVAPPLRRL